MGYKFAARYLSGDPGSGKDIRRPRRPRSRTRGSTSSSCGSRPGRDATDGYNQGVSDATAAKSEAATVVEPSTRPDLLRDRLRRGVERRRLDQRVLPGGRLRPRPVADGVYGGYYIVDELFNEGLVTFGWQTYAWSGGEWDSRAQLRQTDNGVDDDQLDADDGMVTDYGQWGPGAPSTSEYAAAFVSQSFPLATSSALDMVEGQTVAAYIELKNTGTKTWDSKTRIGTTQPRDRTSVFADSSWIAPDRPAGVTGTVPPGGTYKFQFNFHAPDTAGTYFEYFGVLEEGVVWFSNPGQGGPPDTDLEAQIVVTAPEYRGTFVSQTYPLAPTAYTMHVGEIAEGSITLTNSGTKPWVAGTTKLAPIPRDTASPFATSTWLSTSRVSSVPADVQPGKNGTFPLSLEATKVGDFEVELGLVEEGVVWFADAPLGGGPADGFLRVHVTVVAAEADAGESDRDAGAHEDARAPDAAAVVTTDASYSYGDGGGTLDAGAGSGQLRDAGRDSGKHRDSGHPEQPAPPPRDAGVLQAEDDGGTASVSPGSTGGCCMAAGGSPSVAPFALLGLALVVRRRRRGMAG